MEDNTAVKMSCGDEERAQDTNKPMWYKFNKKIFADELRGNGEQKGWKRVWEWLL